MTVTCCIQHDALMSLLPLIPSACGLTCLCPWCVRCPQALVNLGPEPRVVLGGAESTPADGQAGMMYTYDYNRMEFRPDSVGAYATRLLLSHFEEHWSKLVCRVMGWADKCVGRKARRDNWQLEGDSRVACPPGTCLLLVPQDDDGNLKDTVFQPSSYHNGRLVEQVCARPLAPDNVVCNYHVLTCHR